MRVMDTTFLLQAIDVAVQLQKDAADDADTHALSILMLQASQQTPESLDRALQVAIWHHSC